MKTKILILLFMFLVSFLAKAEEKTYRHDHAVCDFKGEKIDLDIRSHEQFSVSEDDEYGEIILVQHQQVPLNDHGIGRYRLLKNYNDFCSKVLATSVKENEIIFFLMKDNRPFTDLVFMLHYNIKTQKSQFVQTEIQTKNAFIKDGKVHLKVARDNYESKHGSVKINGLLYHYFERPFEPWLSFDGQNFKLEHELTLQKFEYKNLLKGQLLKGLSDNLNSWYKIAFNPLLKKKCLSLNKSDWVCQ